MSRFDDDPVCANCGDPASPDAELFLLCPEGSDALTEDVLCEGCMNRGDIDDCSKCGGLWWTGVEPPYDDFNSPGCVCPACWLEAVGND